MSERNLQHVDVFVWREAGGQLATGCLEESEWPGMAGRDAFPVHWVERLEPVALEDIELPAPAPLHQFLAEHRDGEDHLTPRRGLQQVLPCPRIGSEEMPPGLSAILETVTRAEGRLLALERRHAGRLAGLPLWERWNRSAMPRSPDPDRLRSLRERWGADADTQPGRRLLGVLAILEPSADELSDGSPRGRATRLARRSGKLTRRVAALSRRARWGR